MSSSNSEEVASVSRFREFLRLKCIHPDPDYTTTVASSTYRKIEQAELERYRTVRLIVFSRCGIDGGHGFVGRFQHNQIDMKGSYDGLLNGSKCISSASVEFLRRQADEIGLEIKIITIIENNPIVIITWRGSDVLKKSVLLNCHMDVVPVYREYWDKDPFSAYKDNNGNIYARGSQDMRCVGMQYLEAIRVLKKENFVPECSFHLSFVPDEEVGGVKGMQIFVNHEEFKKLNIGFSLDEGLANPSENFSVYYSERSRYVFKITFTGNTGHGSVFIKNTAVEKVGKFIDLVQQYRTEQEADIEKLGGFLGDVTTMNMTTLCGGVQSNVVPNTFVMEIDCRITPTMSKQEVVDKVSLWCAQVGSGVSFEITSRFDGNNVTKKEGNAYCAAFAKAIEKSKIQTIAQVFLGATDSRYLREIGIPAIGFSPMNNTPILLHDHNEYLNEDVFIRGIHIYHNIIQQLATC